MFHRFRARPTPHQTAPNGPWARTRLTVSISPGEARIEGQRSRSSGPISPGAGRPTGPTGCWPAPARPAPKVIGRRLPAVRKPQSHRASVRQPPYQGLSTWPRRDVRPGSIVRLPGHAGLLAGLGAGRPEERLPSAEPLAQPPGPIGAGSVPRGRAWRSLVAAATRRADPARIFLFGLYILFGTKDRARADVGPVPGSGAGRTCRPAGAASGREPA